jgi:PII-like signaling protein
VPKDFMREQRFQIRDRMADAALLNAGSDDVDGPKAQQRIVQRFEPWGVNSVVVRKQDVHGVSVLRGLVGAGKSVTRHGRAPLDTNK